MRSEHLPMGFAPEAVGADGYSLRLIYAYAASYENIMHTTARPAFGLQLTAAHGSARDISNMERLRALRAGLEGPRLERAIGVIYRPDTERFSHYFQTCASSQILVECQWLRCKERCPVELLWQCQTSCMHLASFSAHFVHNDCA